MKRVRGALRGLCMLRPAHALQTSLRFAGATFNQSEFNGKEMEGVPQTLDSQVIINFLASMKREHRVHRLSKVASMAARRAVMFFRGVPSDMTFTTELSIAFLQSAAYFSLNSSENLSLRNAQMYLCNVLSASPPRGGEQESATNTTATPLSLNTICRICLVAIQLKEDPLVRLVVPHLCAMLGEACRAAKDAHTLTSVDASLAIAALHRLGQARGSTLELVFEECKRFGVTSSLGAVLLSAVTTSTTISRDQLVTALSNAVSEETLLIFLQYGRQPATTTPTMEEVEVMNRMERELAGCIGTLWVKCVDRSHEVFHQRFKLMSYHIGSLVSALSRLLSAVALREGANLPSSKLQQVGRQLLLADSHNISTKSGSDHTRDTLPETNAMVSVADVDFFIERLDTLTYRSQMSNGDRATIILGLSKILHAMLVLRQGKSDESTFTPLTPAPLVVKTSGANRFQRRGAAAGQHSGDVSSSVLANEVAGQAAATIPTHLPTSTTAPRLCGGSAVATRFFGSWDDDDVIEWESKVLAFVPALVDAYFLLNTNVRKDVVHGVATVKEMTMMHIGLNLCGVACDELDRSLCMHLWNSKRLLNDGLCSPTEVIRALLSILDAPGRSASLFADPVQLLYSCRSVFDLFVDYQHRVSSPEFQTSDAAEGNELRRIPRSDVINLLQLLTNAGLRCALGVHCAAVVGMIRWLVTGVSTSVTDQLIIIGSAVRYLQGSTTLQETAIHKDIRMIIREVMSNVVSLLKQSSDGSLETHSTAWTTEHVVMAWVFASQVMSECPEVISIVATETEDATMQRFVQMLDAVRPVLVARISSYIDLTILQRWMTRESTIAAWVRIHVVRGGGGGDAKKDISLLERCTGEIKRNRMAAVYVMMLSATEDLTDQQLTDVIAAARTSIRNFSQLVSFAEMVHEQFPEYLCSISHEHSSRVEELQKMILRKFDQLFRRSARLSELVRLLRCIGPQEDMCIAIVNTVSRDLGGLLQRYADFPIGVVTVCPRQFFSAIKEMHPSVRKRGLRELSQVASYAVRSAHRLSDVVDILLFYGEHCAERVVDVAFEIPPPLMVGSSSEIPSSQLLQILDFFRAGKQPKSVRVFRKLLAQLLQVDYVARHQMPLSDVCRLVDVPDTERRGFFWYSCRKQMFRRVTACLKDSIASKRVSGDVVDAACLPPELCIMRWTDWLIVLTFEFMYVPSRNQLNESAEIGSRIPVPATTRAQNESPDWNLHGGAPLLIWLMTTPPPSAHHQVFLSLDCNDAAKLLLGVFDCWNTMRHRPTARQVAPAGSCSNEASIIKTWEQQWDDSVGDLDGGAWIPASQIPCFESMVLLTLKRLFSLNQPDRVASWKCADAEEQHISVDGAVIRDMLIMFLSTQEVPTIDVAIRFFDELITQHRHAWSGVINLEALLRWCEEEYSSRHDSRSPFFEGDKDVSHILKHEQVDLLELHEKILRTLATRISTEASLSQTHTINSLTANATCDVWEACRWLLITRFGGEGSDNQQHQAVWIHALRQELEEHMLALLPSADGAAITRVAMTMMATFSDTTAEFGSISRRILSRVPLLLANDMDNFAMDEVLLLVPALLAKGVMTKSVMDKMIELCSRSAGIEKRKLLSTVEEEGTMNDGWAPMRRSSQIGKILRNNRRDAAAHAGEESVDEEEQALTLPFALVLESLLRWRRDAVFSVLDSDI